MSISTPKRAKTLGTVLIVLIVLIGLLNFHIPHFLLESAKYPRYATPLLEVGLLANLLGALVAAVGYLPQSALGVAPRYPRCRYLGPAICNSGDGWVTWAS
jgi:hypothetical protein